MGSQRRERIPFDTQLLHGLGAHFACPPREFHRGKEKSWQRGFVLLNQFVRAAANASQSQPHHMRQKAERPSKWYVSINKIDSQTFMVASRGRCVVPTVGRRLPCADDPGQCGGPRRRTSARIMDAISLLARARITARL
jgi:hypothetical protein